MAESKRGVRALSTQNGSSGYGTRPVTTPERIAAPLRRMGNPLAFRNPIVTKPVFRLKIFGAVQGVGYRWSMVQEARRLGVRGGVRNCQDGSVEAIVAGTTQALDQIIDWARKGPPSAVVTRVDVLAGEGSFESFEAWPTE